ncbi:MAG: type II glyceraldehyde-3-phosphate dehydrogenase [Candidatus Nanohaloarchaea archaeon]|nr:type II glyceraldehyde-3-phosphate dehydrogenase [Candidatus Nanohaloarchaea archaeon]
MPKIIVNGLGTIGKRVAAAVRRQEDMELAGVADVAPTGELRTVMSEDGPLSGVDLYGSTAEGVQKLEEGGFDVAGDLAGVLDDVDLVVDATPKGIDAKNKENLYEPNDVKAIFQGGADGSIADVKFNANANYDEARDEQFVKLVSCNTTSLCRTLHAVDDNFGVDEVVANLVRRGGDPKQDSRGPINSIIPVQDVPSHHGPDVQEVMPYIDIKTLAVKVPTTLAHVHMVNVELESDATEDEVKRAFRDEPRVVLESAGDGYESTAKLHEKMRDLERPRNDMQEVAIWEETVTVDNGTLYWIHMTHQESIVVPDNIDAIRAMLGMDDRKASMERTDQSLGLE